MVKKNFKILAEDSKDKTKLVCLNSSPRKKWEKRTKSIYEKYLKLGQK